VVKIRAPSGGFEAGHGNLRSVEVLIILGGNVDHWPSTFSAAARFNHPEVVKAFLEAGVNYENYISQDHTKVKHTHIRGLT